MSKIRVIDLLNKIANGEEVPNKVKRINGVIYEYHENSKNYYDTDIYQNALFDDDIGLNLNEELEIIEEEPEIDIQGIEETEIKNDGRMDYFEYFNDGETESKYSVDYSKSDLATRKIINQLIKAVKQLDNQINNK